MSSTSPQRCSRGTVNLMVVNMLIKQTIYLLWCATSSCSFKNTSRLFLIYNCPFIWLGRFKCSHTRLHTHTTLLFSLTDPWRADRVMDQLHCTITVFCYDILFLMHCRPGLCCSIFLPMQHVHVFMQVTRKQCFQMGSRPLL